MGAPKIIVPPPGPKARAIVERDHASMVTTTKTTPLVAKRAEGVVVEDVDGNTYLDFAAGIAVCNTGHRHPKVVQAVKDQMDQFIHVAGTDFYYEVQAAYAEAVNGISPGDFPTKVFYTNSGTESVEAALKLSRWASRRPMVLGFLGAFHGRTTGALAVTASKPVQRARFSSSLVGAVHAPFPNPYRNVWNIDGYENPEDLANLSLEYVEKWLFGGPAPPEDVSAILVEPMQGEGGYVVPPKTFLPRLRKLVDEHGIHLICDEVQSGFGRTGKMFAAEHFGIAPDMMCLAKGIASGMPMGAVVVNAKYDFGVQGAHSNTYGGNPVACAAALATLKAIQDEGMVANASKVGEYLHGRLRELAETHEVIGDARGLGLMLAIDLVKDRATKEPAKKRRNAVVEAAFKRGLILLPCGDSCIRFTPPLNITAEVVDRAIEVVAASLKDTK